MSKNKTTAEAPTATRLKKSGAMSSITEQRIVSREEWLAARKDLLVKEKAFDQERDKLTECRRELPMVKIEREYVFDGPAGPVDLRALLQPTAVDRIPSDVRAEQEYGLQALLLRDG